MQKSSHAHDDPHEAFDPEPVQRLSADETPSPAWLPVVGGGLFLVVAAWAFYPAGGVAPRAPEPTPVAAPSVAPRPAAAPATARPRPTGSAAKMLRPSRPSKPPPKP